MAIETLSDDAFALNLEQDRQTAIAEACAEIARRPAYLATATTGRDFWPQRSEEILEICILDSNGSVLFESLVKARGSISAGAYGVHRITQRMVKNAPTWNEVMAQTSTALVGRRVGLYDAERQLSLLKQTNALYDATWALEEGGVFCVKRLYAKFIGKVYPGGLNSTWLGVWRAARTFGIVHGTWHRAREDAQLTRAVLKHMASHYVVRPPKAMLPRMSLIQRWLSRSHCLWGARKNLKLGP